jgi:hypothetical protein
MELAIFNVCARPEGLQGCNLKIYYPAQSLGGLAETSTSLLGHADIFQAYLNSL